MGYFGSIGATVADRTEIRDLHGLFQLTSNRYPGFSGLNTVDYLAKFDGNWNRERDAFGFGLSANRDSTLQSELATTGIAVARRARSQIEFVPTIQYSIDETTALRLDYHLTNVRYKDSGKVGLIDYAVQSASMAVRRQLTERLTVGGKGSVRHYRNSTDTLTSTSRSASVSADYSATERLKLSFELGAQWTAIQQRSNVLECRVAGVASNVFLCLQGLGEILPVEVTASTRDLNYALNFSADYAFPGGALTLAAGRTVNPSGGNAIVRTDRMWLNYQYQWDETLTMNASLSKLRSHYLNGSGSDVDYLRMGAGLNWRLDPDWALSLEAGRIRQKTEGKPEAAEATEIRINTSYVWRGWRVRH